jgi:hypothetical protein
MARTKAKSTHSLRLMPVLICLGENKDKNDKRIANLLIKFIGFGFVNPSARYQPMP